MKSNNGGQLNTLQKAALLLEVMSYYNHIGVRELARLTNLDKSTVSRILCTLESTALVTRSGITGKFMISSKLWEIANRSIANFEIKERTGYQLRELFRQTNETVLIGVLLQNDVFYIHKMSSSKETDDRNIEIISEIGYRVPLYSSASGKALLAFTTPVQRENLLNSLFYKKTAKNTIASREELEKELEVTIRRGYSINDEELRNGIRAVAAPIYNFRGEVAGVLALTAPLTRMDANRMVQLGKLVVQYSNKMSLELGYQPSSP